MSDSFLYSGDYAAMMSELQYCHVAVRQHSGISSESEAGLSVWTSMAHAPECGLTIRAKGMYVRLHTSLFNIKGLFRRTVKVIFCQSHFDFLTLCIQHHRNIFNQLLYGTT